MSELEEQLLEAIKKHHAQKADDRCIEDDDALYAAAGLPPCDRRVGSKGEMLLNCARFIAKRCESGGWPSYRELEERVVKLQQFKDYVHRRLDEVNVPKFSEKECRIGARLDLVLGTKGMSIRAVLNPNDKVLLVNQIDSKYNGVYRLSGNAIERIVNDPGRQSQDAQ